MSKVDIELKLFEPIEHRLIGFLRLGWAISGIILSESDNEMFMFSSCFSMVLIGL